MDIGNTIEKTGCCAFYFDIKVRTIKHNLKSSKSHLFISLRPRPHYWVFLFHIKAQNVEYNYSTQRRKGAKRGARIFQDFSIRLLANRSLPKCRPSVFPNIAKMLLAAF
jgi:hypothetical protein